MQVNEYVSLKEMKTKLTLIGIESNSVFDKLCTTNAYYINNISRSNGSINSESTEMVYI